MNLENPSNSNMDEADVSDDTTDKKTSNNSSEVLFVDGVCEKSTHNSGVRRSLRSGKIIGLRKQIPELSPRKPRKSIDSPGSSKSPARVNTPFGNCDVEDAGNLDGRRDSNIYEKVSPAAVSEIVKTAATNKLSSSIIVTSADGTSPKFLSKASQSSIETSSPKTASSKKFENFKNSKSQMSGFIPLHVMTSSKKSVNNAKKYLIVSRDGASIKENMEDVRACLLDGQYKNTGFNKYVVSNKQSDRTNDGHTSSETMTSLTPNGNSKTSHSGVKMSHAAVSLPVTGDFERRKTSDSLMIIDVSRSSNDILHVDKENFVCATMCQSTFQDPNSDQVFLLDCNTYFCNFCDFCTEKRADLIGHVMKHRFHCKICSYQSFSRSKVISHTLESHDTFPSEFDNIQYCALVEDYISAKHMVPHSKKRKLTPSVDIPEKSTKMSMDVAKNDDKSDVAKVDGSNAPTADTSSETVPSETVASPEIQKKSNTVEEVRSDTAVSLDAASTSKLTKDPESTKAGNKIFEVSYPSHETVALSCQMCNFLTMKDSIFQIHVNTAHPKYTLRAIHVVISRNEALDIGSLDSIRDSERERGRFDWAKSNLVESHVSYEQQSSIDDSFPRTYQCQNCYGQSLDLAHMKDHLSKKHEGEIFAVKNMKTQFRKTQWIVLCPIEGCYKFFTDSQAFVDHTNNCPCLFQSSSEKMAVDQRAINCTLDFAFSTPSQTESDRVQSCFQCKYCRCSSASKYTTMQHVTTWHSSQIPLFINRRNFDVNYGKVYFCPRCKTCFDSRVNHKNHELKCSISQTPSLID